MKYFTDAVLRAPTLGCMLMCVAASLVGVIIFLNKRSLLGEALSHAAYPGVILGVTLAGIADFSADSEFMIACLIMIGAFLTSLAGLWLIAFLERRLNVRSDSALCFVLSAFFGLGVTLASHVQFGYSTLYKQVQVYMYGQAATMRDIHILIYGVLTLLILAAIILFYKEILVSSFDREYAKTLGINTHLIDLVIFILVTLAVVVGIRSVGVVLMSAMLIAPAAAARQFTNKLYWMFTLAAVFGMLSGFFGVYLSVEFSGMWAFLFPSNRLTLPTGPMIVIVASLICLLSLTFAPKRGFLLRVLRIMRFRYLCFCENLLKGIWRLGPDREVTFEDIAKFHAISPWYLHLVLWRLSRSGWLNSTAHGYQLTLEGKQWASRIVRLHRLWEVYLVEYLGVGAERVHRNAEEMEHIITPELEAQLTLLLKDPKQDPHHQPIPPHK